MKVAFALAVHYPEDERVWFQEAQSLREAGHEIFVVSTKTNHTGLPTRELIERLSSKLLSIVPDIIICDNPLAILAAQRYKKRLKKPVRIIYDITEWYPSKKNLRGISVLQKTLKFFVLIFLSFYTSLRSDGFIFGEYYKAKPFRFFFPWKKQIELSYYADCTQVKTYPVRNLSTECIFFYAGALTKEKGFDTVLNIALACASRFPATHFILRIIATGNDERPAVSSLENLEIQRINPLPFLSFCEEIGKADIFLDLRQIDIENTRCLPIKLFYYMAAGRPVVYSRLKAIRKAVPEIDRVGVLVNPEDRDTIVSCIARYIEDKEYYQGQCRAARQLAEQKYNWENIKCKLVDFMED
jgi:glycosyltransferase involved in cell wall biosynthesis